MTDLIGHHYHCSAATRYSNCIHGFMQSNGCRNISIQDCAHGTYLYPLPRCLNEEEPVPEWNLVKRHRERLERGEL